jgi:hypothetical protein
MDRTNEEGQHLKEVLDWEATQTVFERMFGAAPDLNGALYLIGVQELGQGVRPFSKEEKQDLMHVGLCTILCKPAYYELMGCDQEGWPHFKPLKPMPLLTLEEQEEWLRKWVGVYMIEATR